MSTKQDVLDAAAANGWTVSEDLSLNLSRSTLILTVTATRGRDTVTVKFNRSGGISTATLSRHGQIVSNTRGTSVKRLIVKGWLEQDAG